GCYSAGLTFTPFGSPLHACSLLFTLSCILCRLCRRRPDFRNHWLSGRSLAVVTTPLLVSDPFQLFRALVGAGGLWYPLSTGGGGAYPGAALCGSEQP